jgi:hypothetical protein
MLEQSMTADPRNETMPCGIYPEEMDALLRVRKGLAEEGWELDMDKTYSLMPSFCGSVVCLGGNMFAIMNPFVETDGTSIGAYRSDARKRWDSEMDQYVRVNASPALQCLFYPQVRGFYSTITPAEVVQAIDTWIKNGGKISESEWMAITHDRELAMGYKGS